MVRAAAEKKNDETEQYQTKQNPKNKKNRKNRKPSSSPIAFDCICITYLHSPKVSNDTAGRGTARMNNMTVKNPANKILPVEV